MARTYLDFDLLIIRAAGNQLPAAAAFRKGNGENQLPAAAAFRKGNGETYAARVIDSPSGQASVDFALPFSAQQLELFRTSAGPAARHIRTSAAAPGTDALDARSFGAQLYSAVFAGQIEPAFLRSLDAARRQEKGLRIRLRLTDVPELADLPWEFLYSETLGRFLALSDETPVLRYSELAQIERSLAVAPPLHILAVVSDPHDVDPLNVEQEWAHLQQALGNLQTRQTARLTRLEQATLQALQAALRQSEVHVLHFIGHGFFDAQRNQGGLVFEDDTQRSRPVSAEQLATLVHDHGALRLVFLNACEGGRSGATSAFAGVAQRLVQQGVPAVLAMQFPVGDAAAIALSQEFYAALAGGAALDTALGEARKALYAAGQSFEWGTPVLFSRSPDSALIALDPKLDTTLETPEVQPMTQQPDTDCSPVASAFRKGNEDPERWDEIQAGGDVIIATIGAGGSNVAVGKGITQQIHQLAGPPAPDDKQLIEQKLAELGALLTAPGASLDAAKQQIAELQLQLLRGELTKTDMAESPSAAAITLAGNWLLDNIPSLAEAVSGLFATPAVGRVMARAGEAAVTWVKERFGRR